MSKSSSKRKRNLVSGSVALAPFASYKNFADLRRRFRISLFHDKSDGNILIDDDSLPTSVGNNTAFFRALCMFDIFLNNPYLVGLFVEFFIKHDQRVIENQYDHRNRLQGTFTVATSHEQTATARSTLKDYQFHIVLTYEDDIRTIAGTSVYGCFNSVIDAHKIFFNRTLIENACRERPQLDADDNTNNYTMLFFAKLVHEAAHELCFNIMMDAVPLSKTPPGSRFRQESGRTLECALFGGVITHIAPTNSIWLVNSLAVELLDHSESYRILSDHVAHFCNEQLWIMIGNTNVDIESYEQTLKKLRTHFMIEDENVDKNSVKAILFGKDILVHHSQDEIIASPNFSTEEADETGIVFGEGCGTHMINHKIN